MPYVATTTNVVDAMIILLVDAAAAAAAMETISVIVNDLCGNCNRLAKGAMKSVGVRMEYPSHSQTA